MFSLETSTKMENWIVLLSLRYHAASVPTWEHGRHRHEYQAVHLTRVERAYSGNSIVFLYVSTEEVCRRRTEEHVCLLSIDSTNKVKYKW